MYTVYSQAQPQLQPNLALFKPSPHHPPTSQNKKIKNFSKMAENYEKFFFRKNVRYLVKFQYFELYFFCANILILIVLTDSTIYI